MKWHNRGCGRSAIADADLAWDYDIPVAR